ncbi:unnamed protein product [Moneuplotes crassus]|uniref:Uncharacterized protein n=1 Tax=Euplotes crassus TaxID=5936 RepID=A0AAD2D3I2_EUPCR|nr:unnamed protein product [Moneuplotes crassus]
MDYSVNNPQFDDFLKFDDQLLKMQAQLEKQAQQFGFENDNFIKDQLPNLEKKYGPAILGDDDGEDEMPPTPDALPTQIKTKAMDNEHPNVSKSKTKGIKKINKTSAVKKKKEPKVNDDLFQTQKYEVATKATTYKDMKETRYNALPTFTMPKEEPLAMKSTKAPKVGSKYKKSMIDSIPQFGDLYDETFYETQYKDEIEIKPKHISGCDGDNQFQKFYYKHFTKEYSQCFM